MLNCQITQTTCFILPSVKTIICKSILLSFFFWHKIWVKYDSDGFSDPINVQTFLMLRLGILSVSGFFKGGGGGECFWSAFIKFDWQMTEPWKLLDLTLSDMGFFEPSIIGGRGGGHEGPTITLLLLLWWSWNLTQTSRLMYSTQRQQKRLWRHFYHVIMMS